MKLITDFQQVKIGAYYIFTMDNRIKRNSSFTIGRAEAVHTVGNTPYILHYILYDVILAGFLHELTFVNHIPLTQVINTRGYIFELTDSEVTEHILLEYC